MNRFKKSGQSQLLFQTQLGNQLNEKKNKSKISVSSCNKDIGIFKNIFIENSIIGSIKDSVQIPNIHVEELSNPNYTPVKVIYGITIENNNNLEDNSVLTKIQIEELIEKKLTQLLGKVDKKIIENLEENNNVETIEVIKSEEKSKVIKSEVIKSEEKCEEICEEICEEKCEEICEEKCEEICEEKNIEDRLDEITLEEKSLKSTDIKRGKRNYKKNQ